MARYTPSSLVTDVRAVPVSMFVTVTDDARQRRAGRVPDDALDVAVGGLRLGSRGRRRRQRDQRAQHRPADRTRNMTPSSLFNARGASLNARGRTPARFARRLAPRSGRRLAARPTAQIPTLQYTIGSAPPLDVVTLRTGPAERSVDSCVHATFQDQTGHQARQEAARQAVSDGGGSSTRSWRWRARSWSSSGCSATTTSCSPG